MAVLKKERAKEDVLFLTSNQMHYTYILESITRPGEHYTGHTSELHLKR